MMRGQLKTRTLLRAPAMAGLLACAVVGGCRGDRTDNPPRQFLPDMDDSPKFKPQTQTRFFADGRAMRRPVAGTVAYGTSAMQGDAERGVYLREDGAVYTGMNASGEFLERMPMTPTREMIARGQERFGIYCSVCHGYQGDGKGAVGIRWAAPVPSFHDPKYRDKTQKQGLDGYLFHTSRNGVVGPTGTQNMPGYAHALSVEDSWSIVAYMRVLQQTRLGTLDDVPEAARGQLERTRSAQPPASPPASPPAPVPTPATESKEGNK